MQISTISYFYPPRIFLFGKPTPIKAYVQIRCSDSGKYTLSNWRCSRRLLVRIGYIELGIPRGPFFVNIEIRDIPGKCSTKNQLPTTPMCFQRIVSNRGSTVHVLSVLLGCALHVTCGFPYTRHRITFPNYL